MYKKFLNIFDSRNRNKSILYSFGAREPPNVKITDMPKKELKAKGPKIWFYFFPLPLIVFLRENPFLEDLNASGMFY